MRRSQEDAWKYALRDLRREDDTFALYFMVKVESRCEAAEQSSVIKKCIVNFRDISHRKNVKPEIQKPHVK